MIKIEIPNDEKAVKAMRAFCDSYLGYEAEVMTIVPASEQELTVSIPTPAEEHPATVPPVQPATDLLDDRGVPWSEEHHAGTKTKKNDGSWKAKKGGDKDALTAYESQFLNAPCEPAAGTMPPVESPVPPAAGQPTFADVMMKATYLTANGKSTPEGINAICQQHGLSTIQDVARSPQLIPTILAALEAVA